MKNHTYSHHIWCDAKSKLKGHGVGYLKKSTDLGSLKRAIIVPANGLAFMPVPGYERYFY